MALPILSENSYSAHQPVGEEKGEKERERDMETRESLGRKEGRERMLTVIFVEVAGCAH